MAYVLVIEDNKLAQFGVKAILLAAGCKVDIAESGTQTMKIAHNPYDLFIVDIGLGDTDGFTLTEDIKKEFPQHKDSLFVALTAHIEKDFFEKAAKVGMQDVYAKPFTQELCNKLLDMVSTRKTSTNPS